MKKIVSTYVLICFFVTAQIGMSSVYAQGLFLPSPGTMVHLSPSYNPPVLKGIKVHADDPFKFDFILDKGDSNLTNQGLKEESMRLIKYFLASLTIPEKDLWVNLSPYEKDRIVPESFGQTEMGRDLLAQDYLLKQITASLIYPEDEIGKKFWKRIYEESAKKYGSTKIPVNTFNKVWIMPDKAVIYENAKAGTAYVVASSLKVLTEQDYLASTKNNNKDNNNKIIRDIIIPQLNTEINTGKNFFQLRQVYSSLILATWYKKKIKDSILSQVYTDKNKIAGVNPNDPQEKQKIYERYIQAFRKGSYNYIKEEQDPISREVTPRKYFSGGVDNTHLDLAMTTTPDIPELTGDDEIRLSLVETRVDQITSKRTRDLAMTIQDLSFGAGKANMRTALKAQDLESIMESPGKYYVGARSTLRDKTQQWASERTSLERINKEFNILERARELHRKKTLEVIQILDWGCGDGSAIIELNKILNAEEIPHHIYGFSSDYFSKWKEADHGITFILDDASHLLEYFRADFFDVIYSFIGLWHVWKQDYMPDRVVINFERRFEEVGMILKPGGYLLMDAKANQIGSFRFVFMPDANGTQYKKPDHAMTIRKGGIDLTPDKFLQTQNQGESIKFHLDSAMLQQLQNIQGFTPKIINIQTLADLRLFLDK